MPIHLNAEPIHYSTTEVNKNAATRKQHKNKLMKEKPEYLFADLYTTGDVSNLIFFTDQPTAWHSAISSSYPSVQNKGISKGWQLRIKEAEDPDSVIITVNLYKNGTVMVQGDLRTFEKDFESIKEIARKEKTALNETFVAETDSTGTTSMPSTQENRIDQTRHQDSDSPLHSDQAQTQHALAHLNEHVIQLETELVQLREQVNAQHPGSTEELLLSMVREQDSNIAAHQRTAKQERDNHERRLAELTEEVRELQRERDSCRTEITLLKGELKKREREIESLQNHIHSHSPGQLSSTSSPRQPASTLPPPGQPASTSAPTGQPASITPVPGQPISSTRPPGQPISSSRPPGQPVSSSRPPGQPVSSTCPPGEPVPSTCPPGQPASSTCPPGQPASAIPTPAQQISDRYPRPEIVLLIDSNGKFIEEKKLFPNHCVEKIWCPTTERAMQLLTEAQLGSPSHIIIHTGTNELRAQQEKVAVSLRRVIEKASGNFPNSRIVLSTLLQRKDFHPATIQRINASLSQDCARRHNVYLAHHPNLDLNCLYDQVHIYKTSVPVFAKSLKDVALNRNPAPPPTNSRGTSVPLSQPEHHPRSTPRNPLRRPQYHQYHEPQYPPPPLPPNLRPLPARHTSLLTSSLPRAPSAEPQPSRQTYAQATQGPTPSNELNDIQRMLSLLCSHLMGTF